MVIVVSAGRPAKIEAPSAARGEDEDTAGECIREARIRSVRARADTFVRQYGDDPPINFPNQLEQKPDVLAKSGFVWTGLVDEVRCVFCELVVRDWRSGEDVHETHRTLSPRCHVFAK